MFGSDELDELDASEEASESSVCVLSALSLFVWAFRVAFKYFVLALM